MNLRQVFCGSYLSGFVKLLAAETDSFPALRTLFHLLVCLVQVCCEDFCLVLLPFVFAMCGPCLLDVCCFLKRRQRGSGSRGERLQRAGRSGRRRNCDLYKRRIYLKENLVFNLKEKVYSKSQMIL